MDQEPTLRQKIGALMGANPKMTFEDACVLLGIDKNDPRVNLASAIEEFLGGAPIAGEQANRYPKRGNDA